ncbi:MAG: SIR2 family NAD-dependent protein deacylase [Bacteroidota bacterium]
MKDRKQIVVLSGAGMSAESGIKTFRDSDGLWENHRIEEVATPQAWNTNPTLVQEFYNQRRKNVLEAQPNAAHLFLAELEQYADVQIVTQNIDDLHERAGSSRITHLHGNIRLAKSSGPNPEAKYYPVEGWELRMDQTCDEGHTLRPHVVWFGEAVPLLEKAAGICLQADILLVIGTSLQVYPAANLIHYTRKDCRKIIVDPNAGQIMSDKSYTVINETAVNSIPFLRKLLLG